MIPTVYCTVTSSQGVTGNAFDNTNLVVLDDGLGGLVEYTCEPGSSSVLGISAQAQYLSESDFYALWAGCIGILVAGYCVRMLLKMLV